MHPVDPSEHFYCSNFVLFGWWAEHSKSIGTTSERLHFAVSIKMFSLLPPSGGTETAQKNKQQYSLCYPERSSRIKTEVRLLMWSQRRGWSKHRPSGSRGRETPREQRRERRIKMMLLEARSIHQSDIRINIRWVRKETSDPILETVFQSTEHVRLRSDS